MIDAIINKGGDFYRANGYAGLLGFIGGREGLIKRTYPQGSPAWKEGTDAYNAAWSLTNLSKLNSALIDSESFIDEAWSLITNYADKDLFGTGAYDYGQSPPMSCDPNKVIWRQGNQVVIRK